MKTVFLLWHIHKLPEQEDDEKLLGVYSSKKMAEEKIKEKYKLLPGFKEPSGEFIIDEYGIDQDDWEEGFVTVYSKDTNKSN